MTATKRGPGRPRKDAEAARALERVERGLTRDEAAAEAEAKGSPVSARTLRRRQDEARRAAEGAPLVQVQVGKPSPSPAAPPAASPAPLAVLERVEGIRRMVAAGEFGARAVAQLAASLGVGVDEVRGLLLEAAAAEHLDRMPADLARAESIAFARAARQSARAAGDVKGALTAQQHLDRLYGVDPRTAGKGDVVPRDEVVGLLRRAAEALKPFPEAFAAFRSVVSAHGAT